MFTIEMVEFPSSSAGGSAEFMSTVFGWTVTPYGPTYTDVNGGGIALGFQADAAEQTAAPLVVIKADDLDAAQAAIVAAGGVITVPTFDFPGGSRFHFREPGGSELAVYKPSE